MCPGPGGLAETEGSEALLQNVLFRLTARRGSFPFWPELGPVCISWGACRRQNARAPRSSM